MFFTDISLHTQDNNRFYHPHTLFLSLREKITLKSHYINGIIHIRIYRRVKNNSITALCSTDAQFNWKLLLKNLKKHLCVIGAYVIDEESFNLKFKGDQRHGIRNYLMCNNLAYKDQIRPPL
jgi:hypothetical protein